MKHSKLLIIVALVVVPGTPAFAKKHHSAKSQLPGYAYARSDQDNSSRSEAIETCSTQAAKWRYSDWQTAQITNYRVCMTKHGQPFE
jgi:hypothetical protein